MGHLSRTLTSTVDPCTKAWYSEGVLKCSVSARTARSWHRAFTPLFSAKMTPRAAVTSPRQNADRSSPRQRADPEEDDGPGARGPDDPSSERTPLLPRNDDCDVLNGKAATPLPKRPV